MEIFGNVTSKQRTYQIVTITSLPGKRFQSSYCAKMKGEGKKRFPSLPLPLNLLFFSISLSLSSQRSQRTRAETLAAFLPVHTKTAQLVFKNGTIFDWSMHIFWYLSSCSNSFREPSFLSDHSSTAKRRFKNLQSGKRL